MLLLETLLNERVLALRVCWVTSLAFLVASHVLLMHLYRLVLKGRTWGRHLLLLLTRATVLICSAYRLKVILLLLLLMLLVLVELMISAIMVPLSKICIPWILIKRLARADIVAVLILITISSFSTIVVLVLVIIVLSIIKVQHCPRMLLFKHIKPRLCLFEVIVVAIVVVVWLHFDLMLLWRNLGHIRLILGSFGHKLLIIVRWDFLTNLISVFYRTCSI